MMNPFKWNTGYLHFFSLRQFPFIFFFFQCKKYFIKALGQVLWIESPFIFYYCFCSTLAFSLETLLFILYFSFSIFFHYINSLLLSLSTTFWENISSYPMIHQLDFIYFIVSALNHFHCEYIIVLWFPAIFLYLVCLSLHTILLPSFMLSF